MGDTFLSICPTTTSTIIFTYIPLHLDVLATILLAVVDKPSMKLINEIDQ